MDKKIYFPGLNAIRFYAALSVVVYHMRDVMNWFGISPADIFLRNFVLNSYDAVRLFFVLSGFLITYLLLEEINRTRTVNVKKFYTRRILRIWPLYYFLVFIGFVVLPLAEVLIGSPGYASVRATPMFKNILKFLAYMLLFPHIPAYFGSYITGIGQLWSIGVEENFYLIWPWLGKKFANHMLKVLVGIIAFKVALNILMTVLTHIAGFPPMVITLLNLINSIQIECMAIGGLGAYMLFYKRQRVLDIVFHPVVEKLVLLLMLGNIFLYKGTTWVGIILLAFLYMLFIMNVCSNPKSTLKLENHVFNELGKISYGIYMYHVAIIYVVMMILSRFHVTEIGVVYSTLLYISLTIATVMAARLSYIYIERPFLRLKRTYVVVESGDPLTIANRESLIPQKPPVNSETVHPMN